MNHDSKKHIIPYIKRYGYNSLLVEKKFVKQVYNSEIPAEIGIFTEKWRHEQVFIFILTEHIFLVS